MPKRKQPVGLKVKIGRLSPSLISIESRKIWDSYCAEVWAEAGGPVPRMGQVLRGTLRVMFEPEKG